MVLAPRNKQVETCQIRRQTAMIVVHEPIFFEVDSSRNPTIFNIICWVTGSMGQLSHLLSFECLETCQIRRQTAMIVVNEPIFFEVDSSSYARLEKSNNLQYDMLGHWVYGTIVSLTKF